MLSRAHGGEALDESGEALAGWTPEQQLAQMLELCESQMESALCESDLAVDRLVRAFTGLAEAARAARELGAQAGDQALGGRLDEQLEAIARQTTSAIVAFQFYDKLTQRLGHVRYSLSTLAMFVCDRAQSSEPRQWQRLFNTLRRLYRTEEEREIFKMMIEGASADAAREHIHQATATLRAERTGEIELF